MENLGSRDASGNFYFHLQDVEPVDRVPIRSVLDLDENGKILGIEIISLMPVIGARRTNMLIASPPVMASYDPDADALYIRVGHGRSVNQISADSHLGFDSVDMLVSIEVPDRPDTA